MWPYPRYSHQIIQFTRFMILLVTAVSLGILWLDRMRLFVWRLDGTRTHQFVQVCFLVRIRILLYRFLVQKCEDISKLLQNITYLNVTVSTPPSPTHESWIKGTKLHFSCEDGHVLNGSPAMYCIDATDGTLRWSENTLPTCEGKPGKKMHCNFS